MSNKNTKTEAAVASQKKRTSLKNKNSTSPAGTPEEEGFVPTICLPPLITITNVTKELSFAMYFHSSRINQWIHIMTTPMIVVGVLQALVHYLGSWHPLTCVLVALSSGFCAAVDPIVGYLTVAFMYCTHQIAYGIGVWLKSGCDKAVEAGASRMQCESEAFETYDRVWVILISVAVVTQILAHVVWERTFSWPRWQELCFGSVLMGLIALRDTCGYREEALVDIKQRSAQWEGSAMIDLRSQRSGKTR